MRQNTLLELYHTFRAKSREEQIMAQRNFKGWSWRYRAAALGRTGEFNGNRKAYKNYGKRSIVNKLIGENACNKNFTFKDKRSKNIWEFKRMYEH